MLSFHTVTSSLSVVARTMSLDV